MKSWSHVIRRWHIVLAGGLLMIMFGLGLSSMSGNSAIVDELAHIPAGYAYLHYGDYRLNPEHPPLMKDLAAIPLQFMNLKFPLDSPAWTSDANGQWEIGWSFLYHLGNDATSVLFWSRLPILLLAICFGAWLYWFVQRRWGVAVGLMTLLFYTLSPNILAHATLVTTDLGASAFTFGALVAFAWYVERPTRARLLWLSAALALAQVAKFSAFLLYPFLLGITLVLVGMMQKPVSAWLRLKVYSGGLVLASALSMVWVWLFYVPHVWNMPQSVQDRLINGAIYNPDSRWIADVLMNLNNYVIFKPLAQYFLGLAMVFGRVAGGNVTYFNGQVTNQSFHGYFPELFVVKTQVALLILMCAALGWAVWRWRRGPQEGRVAVLEWTIGSFAAFYFGISVAGNLDLGIRHVLPIYIPIFVLVAVGTVKLWRRLSATSWRWVSTVGLVGLLGWYSASTAFAAPYFIPYFNELIDGPANADKYFSDSSVDWGQDLVRLRTYVNAHPEITHIAVDYFGGAVPEYYFCVPTTTASYDCSDSKYEAWHSQYGRYTGQYIAVSETFLENDRWYSAVNGTAGYEYLRAMKPIAKVGYSIYVYKLY